MQDELLIIFTRNPELGKVKSRLAKDVGEQAALDIYLFLLDRTKSITQNLPQIKQVHYSESITEDDLWPDSLFEKRIQSDGDLGEKMRTAFKNGFHEGYKRIVIIGSDLYDLKETDIRQAFKKLNKTKVVLGPAQDGGYYLLGMTSLYEEVFQEIPWGTDQVFTTTLKKLGRVQAALLPERNDADYLSDIIDVPVFQPFIKHIRHDQDH